MNLIDTIKKYPICAILRKIPDDMLDDYAKAAYQGGIRMFEVAMNTDGAAQQIERLQRILPDDAVVGAGTVLSLADCNNAHSAGARFFLTPSASEETLNYCRQLAVPVIPGVMTPSDVALCMKYGCHLLKLFPAGCMPQNYLKSLKGPFSTTEYIAVGGVSPANMLEFFQQGYIGVGIGSNLIPKEYADNRKWGLAAEYLRKELERCGHALSKCAIDSTFKL